MRYLISYDVADDKRRYRVVEALKDYAHRVQFSVFECDLEEAEIEILLKRVKSAIKEKEDSCRVYRLCAACWGEVVVIGKGEPWEEPGAVII